jgi:hypothetical protein
MPPLGRRACGFALGGEGFEGDAAGDADAGLKGGAATEADLGCCASVEEGFVAAVEAGFGVGAALWAGSIVASEEEGFCAAAGMPLDWMAEERGCRYATEVYGRGRRCCDNGGL